VEGGAPKRRDQVYYELRYGGGAGAAGGSGGKPPLSPPRGKGGKPQEVVEKTVSLTRMPRVGMGAFDDDKVTLSHYQLYQSPYALLFVTHAPRRHGCLR